MSVLLKTPYVTVDTVRARTESGVEYDHARVISGTGGGVLVVPYILRESDRKVTALLVRQFRPVLGRTSLEFPRGRTEPEDTRALGTALRELHEETGVSEGHIIGEPVSLGRIAPDTGLLTTEVDVFAVRMRPEVLDLVEHHVEDESGAKNRWCDWDELPSRLRCGMSLAAWALAGAVIA